MPVYLNGKKVSPAQVYPPTHAGDYEVYDGPYAVNPLTDAAQNLATAQKVLLNDIVVQKIYYSAVSNVSGGNTVYIGI